MAVSFMIDDNSDVNLDGFDPDIRAEIGDPVPLSFAATVVYVPLLVVAGILAVFWTHTIPGRARTVIEILTEVGLGLGLGVVFVLVTRLMALCFQSVRELDQAFRTVLEPLTGREVSRLSVLSGTAEEFVFRGVLQPLIGYIPTSILFGFVHFVPGSRVFLPWTIFALGGGFIFGGLCEWRGSLIAPVVAHILYNGANIYLLRRRHARGEDQGLLQDRGFTAADVSAGSARE